MADSQEFELWRSTPFRNSMTSRIAHELQGCQPLSGNDPADLERQVYARATDRIGYLNSIGRLLIYLQDMVAMVRQPNSSAQLPATGLIGLRLDDDNHSITVIDVIDVNKISQYNLVGQGVQGIQPGPSTGAGAQPSPEPDIIDVESLEETEEDRVYREKVKDLQIYVDILQYKLECEAKTDIEKRRFARMLDILTNPATRVPMDVLMKCDDALRILGDREIEKLNRHVALGHVPPLPEPEPEPPKVDDFLCAVQEFSEAFLATHKNKSFSSMESLFRRVAKVGPVYECLTGQSASSQESNENNSVADEMDQSGSPAEVLLKRELKLVDRRFQVNLTKNTDTDAILIIAKLLDEKLPMVPPLKINIPADYPDQNPTPVDIQQHNSKAHNSCKLSYAVGQALRSGVQLLPNRFSVLELLSLWEMCVREASNPNRPGPSKR